MRESNDTPGRRPALVLALAAGSALLLGGAAAEAQIVNTLRGFGDEEPGWSGNLEGTVAVVDGNTEYLEIELSTVLQVRRGPHRWRALGGLLRRTSEGETIANNTLGHLRHNYQVRPWAATVLFLQGQHDRFLRLETRLLAGAGLRFDLLRAEGWEGSLGATYMREEEEITDVEGFLTNHRLSCFLSMVSAKTETVRLDVSGFWQPRLGRIDDARALVTASLRVAIGRGFYVLSKYSLVHDAEPPADVEPTDQRFRSGLGYAF